MATAKTAAKKTTATKAAHNGHARLSDDELGKLIERHLAQHPEDGPSTIYHTLRGLGKSVSGGRVRTLWQAATKPVAKAKKTVAKK